MNASTPMNHLGGDRAHIRYLQRAELDEQGLNILPGEIDAALRTAIALDVRLPLWFVELRGIHRCWQVDRSQDAGRPYLTTDILAGLNGQRIPLYFLIRGQPKWIRLYVGTMAEPKEYGATIRAAFNSYYPGIKLWPDKDLFDTQDQEQSQELVEHWNELDKELQQGVRPFIHSSQHIGVITGIPTANVVTPNNDRTQLDRLISGLYGTRWALLVLAEPIEDAAVVEIQLALFREQMRVEQEAEFRERRESAGQSVAIYYHQLLQMQQQFLETCLYEGGWWVQSYICSPDLATYHRAKGLIKSVFSGEFSRLDRIRVLDCFGAAPKAASFSSIVADRSFAPFSELSSGKGRSFKYHTLVSSGQLSALIHLPRTEMPGYYVQESAVFDVSSHVPATERCIEIGEILDRGRSTGNPYRVPVKDLTKHCLLVGITGSGKTTTSQHLLRQLQEQDPPIPFLVIEPAKREYREMAGLMPSGRKLRVFTVGEEHQASAPFRLNPFEIRGGVSVQTHIDLLKSVFNASFGMWSPLPQVLERAIHEIYRDKGWDTVQSDNKRAATEENERGWHPFAQPTLTDLFHKVGELVPRLGYDKEVERNVRTALETRINSLRIGAKGLMLDTRESIPIEHLLAGPTVLELEGVGDDDEKAFIMGLILTAVYEYYRNPNRPPVPGQKIVTAKGPSAPWRHITVIEEAHRLLTNVPVSTDPEATNLKGKAVETFVNMLSEVRAYGEGFIIAEQIPTKLAPDVIKNTALKIMQRTVAIDDREVMGGAMNLTDSQMRRVVALETGEAVVHGGGDDNAFLVKIKPRPKAKAESKEAIEGIRSAWKHFIKENKSDEHSLQEIFLSYPTCSSYCLSQDEDQLDRLPEVQAICVNARRIAEDPLVEETFNSFILSLVAGSRSRNKGELPTLLGGLYQYVGEALRSRLTGDSQDFAQIRCALTHALYRYLEKRGAQYGWKYKDTEQMATLLLPFLLDVAANPEGKWEVAGGLSDFCEAYQRQCQLNFTPFYGCDEVCGDPSLCLFRYGIEPLLRNQLLANDFESAGNDIEKLAAACEEAYKRVIAFPTDSASKEETADHVWRQVAAMCFAIQKVHLDPSTWPTTHRQYTIKELLRHFRKKEQSSPDNQVEEKVDAG